MHNFHNHQVTRDFLWVWFLFSFNIVKVFNFQLLYYIILFYTAHYFEEKVRNLSYNI